MRKKYIITRISPFSVLLEYSINNIPSAGLRRQGREMILLLVHYYCDVTLLWMHCCIPLHGKVRQILLWKLCHIPLHGNCFYSLMFHRAGDDSCRVWKKLVSYSYLHKLCTWDYDRLHTDYQILVVNRRLLLTTKIFKSVISWSLQWKTRTAD